MPAPKDPIKRKQWIENISINTKIAKKTKEKVKWSCQQCGKIKYVTPYVAGTKKYCSKECFNKSRRGQKLTTKHKESIKTGTTLAMARHEVKKKQLDNQPDRSGKNNSMYGKKKAKHKSDCTCSWCKAERGELKGENHPGYGLKRTQEQKDTMSRNHADFSGENNPNWLDGKSFESYGIEFNNKLREKIRQRDNYKCQMCWTTENDVDHKLSVHHIDYDKKNNHEDNLILLCQSCHIKTNFSRKDWQIHFKKLLKKPKIFVSVLNQGWVRTELTFALVQWFKETDYRVYLEAPSDRPIENNRNMIVRRFLRTGYDYLLQIDCDNVPVHNPLKLVEYGKDVISCPVPIYSSSMSFLNVFKKNIDDSLTPLKKEEVMGLTEVDATGTGIILCSRKILEKIKKPFSVKYNDDGISILGLDLYFSQKTKEANFKIYAHGDYISSHYKTLNLEKLL